MERGDKRMNSSILDFGLGQGSLGEEDFFLEKVAVASFVRGAITNPGLPIRTQKRYN
jgi:hypothetical protein